MVPRLNIIRIHWKSAVSRVTYKFGSTKVLSVLRSGNVCNTVMAKPNSQRIQRDAVACWWMSDVDRLRRAPGVTIRIAFFATTIAIDINFSPCRNFYSAKAIPEFQLWLCQFLRKNWWFAAEMQNTFWTISQVKPLYNNSTARVEVILPWAAHAVTWK